MLYKHFKVNRQSHSWGKLMDNIYLNKPLTYVIEMYAKEHDLEVVMYFPHSSVAVPSNFWKDVEALKGYFNFLNLKMSDLLLLELFASWNYKKVIYRRIIGTAGPGLPR